VGHTQYNAVHRPHTPFAGFLLHGVFLLYILVVSSQKVGGTFLLWKGYLLGEEAASLGRTIGIIGIIAIGAAEAAMRRERK